MTTPEHDGRPGRAGHARRGRSPHQRSSSTGVVLAHISVAALGVGVLVWTASPLVYDGVFGSSGVRSWILLAISALVCGGIGGMVEAVALVAGHRFLACVALVAAALPAIWLPFLVVGRWFSDQDQAFGTSTLFQPVLGWLTFVVVISVTAVSGAATWGRARS